MKKVLLVGSGGRESALAQSIIESSCVELYVAPGNAGMAKLGTLVPIAIDEVDSLVDFAVQNKMDWVIVGPELPLSLGLTDRLRAKKIKCFGVSQLAAKLESSKSFAKSIMNRYNVATASYVEVDDMQHALAALKDALFPLVIKADGLAAGKGVFICQDRDTAQLHLEDLLVKKSFGQAGSKVIIEEFLDGHELSAFAFTDGYHILPLIYAQDYKKLLDGDKGLNTGGMGSYAPVDWVNNSLKQSIMNDVFKPIINGLSQEGILYQGILYAGLMIQHQQIKVLEFNVRFGDPEAQVILPLLKTPLLDVFDAIEDQRLDKLTLDWSDKKAICVVLASKGYPGSYVKGLSITGLDNMPLIRGQQYVFHAGTKQQSDSIVTHGGRVLNCVLLGDDLSTIRKQLYTQIAKIYFENCIYRSDIAQS